MHMLSPYVINEMRRYRKHLSTLKKDIDRFGLFWAVLGFIYRLVKRTLFLEILYIILNDRDKLTKPKSKVQERLSFKIATKEDLLNLKDKKEYQVDDDKIELHDSGVMCLLNYSDNEVAGYTHADLSGRPTLKPYLKLDIPDTMIYNFAGLTVPKFRGRNHHAMRHYELMQLPQCMDKRYMMGYVDFSNLAALRGDKKSGYSKIGHIAVFGIRGSKCIRLSKGLRSYNIRLTRENKNT